MKRGGNWGVLYILPGFAGLCVFYIIPFVISLGYVFGRGNGETGRIGTENFKDLLGNPAFQLAAKNTLVFTLLAVPLLTLGALFLAMFLGQKQSPLVQSALSVSYTHLDVYKRQLQDKGSRAHWLTWLSSAKALSLIHI